MAFDAGKPARNLRLNMKQIARLLLAVHTAGQELSREATALNINYAVDQGTYLTDTDAAAFLTLLNNSVLTFLQSNAAVITKGADLGDNIT